MFRKAYHSMTNLPVMHDICNTDEIPFAYEEEKSTHNLSTPDNFKLYKIPRYLEKVFFLNSIVYIRLISLNHQFNNI